MQIYQEKLINFIIIINLQCFLGKQFGVSTIFKFEKVSE